MAKIMAVGPGQDEMGIDVDDEQLEGLSLGQEVTIVVKGKISSLNAPEKFEDGDDWPGRVRIAVEEQRIEAPNVFEQLAEDD